MRAHLARILDAACGEKLVASFTCPYCKRAPVRVYAQPGAGRETRRAEHDGLECDRFRAQVSVRAILDDVDDEARA